MKNGKKSSFHGENEEIINMNIQEECFDIFNKYKTVSQKFEEMAMRVSVLNASVQNPEFISKDDFHMIAGNNASALEYLQSTFNNCYGELLELFERTAKVYQIENVEEYR